MGELQDMQKECDTQRSALATRMRELEEMCISRSESELRNRELEASIVAGQIREEELQKRMHDLLTKPASQRPVVPSLSQTPISKPATSEPELYDISSARRNEATESASGTGNTAPLARVQGRPPRADVPALLNGKSLATLGLWQALASGRRARASEHNMEEQHVPGVGVVQTPRRHRGPESAAGRPPKAGVAHQRSRPKVSQQGSKPMPMDLSALGNLLSGGGMFGKGNQRHNVKRAK